MALIHRADSQTITRPADTTAYASGDLVANSTTAGSVTPFTVTFNGSAATCSVRRALVTKSTSTIANATFRLHIFGVSPVVAAGDNAAIAPTALASYNYLGSLTGATVLGGGTTGAVVQLAPDAGDVWIMQQKVFCLLEARGAYAPGNAETFFVSLFAALEA